jgi:large subunit ribosomal protein L5
MSAKKNESSQKSDKPAKTPKGDGPGKLDAAAQEKKQARAEAKARSEGKASGEKAPVEKGPKTPVPVPRLQERYRNEIVPALAKKFGRANILSLPRLRKIVINMGVGKAITEKKYLEEAVEALKTIAGQKPIITRARLSVAGFKLREEQAIGCKVTLRGKRMYEFLDRLISLALPRVRDFRGLSSTGFDGNGNYSLGLTEQLVFPELNPDKFTNVQGMNVTLVTNCGNDDESRELLRAIGMPLRTSEK